MVDAAYADKYRGINFREHPEQYEVGRGEQGVLIAEPYKSEILPYWKFATPEAAQKSAEKIYELFGYYKKQSDFVGMDMARKFLQMGFTRARRYANHAGGKKYKGPVPADKKGQSGSHGREQLPKTAEDPAKAKSAQIFYEYYDKARNDERYKELKSKHSDKQNIKE